MLSRFVVVVLSMTVASSALAEGWKKHVIVPAGIANGGINGVIANDWDGDGHMDVMTSFAGKVVLIAGPDWKRQTVVHRFGPRDSQRKVGRACIHNVDMDVDRDGDIDFVGSCNTVFWLECPKNPFEGAWTYRTVDDDILGTHCLITGDVDGDGKLDLIANSGRSQGTEFPDSLTWQKVPRNWKAAPRWERHVFAQKDAPGGSHYTGFGDVDGDGKPDISCAAKGGEKFPGGQWFAWWQQPKDGSTPWKKHMLADKQVGATNIIPVDLNKDGRMDFAATRGHGVGVLWFKGPDFKLIEIDREINNPHSLALGDVNGDGNIDIATCGSQVSGVAAWYENDGAGGFTKHVIGRDQSSYDTRLIDMDGDDDLDLLIAGHFSKNVVWYENPSKSKRAELYPVTPPPAHLKLKPFYKKYVSANGFPITSSDRVSDYALKEAAYILDIMLAKRPDVRKAMIDSGSRLIVMAYNEYSTDIPEYSHFRPKDFYDRRARGFGGSQRDPLCSCAEENVLAYKGDPYHQESILIHEFAHNIHLRGMVRVDKTFDRRVKAAYDAAMKKGLWKDKYASVNHHEYFAEGVQSWFNNNRPPDHDHNHVDTRKELIEYDPGLAALCKEVFRDTEFEYTKPPTRLTGHLAGYDPAKSPTFEWPERLKKLGDVVRQQSLDKRRKKNKN